MLQTEPNFQKMGKNQINDTLFNEEFIGYINSLSGAILEYFKVSQNIIKNTDRRNMPVCKVDQRMV